VAADGWLPETKADRAESARARPVLARAHAGGKGEQGGGKHKGEVELRMSPDGELPMSSSHQPEGQLRGAPRSVEFATAFHYSLQL
jgi:hypothetical protein